jgi:hypothetical protein
VGPALVVILAPPGMPSGLLLLLLILAFSPALSLFGFFRVVFCESANRIVGAGSSNGSHETCVKNPVSNGPYFPPFLNELNSTL